MSGHANVRDVDDREDYGGMFNTAGPGESQGPSAGQGAAGVGAAGVIRSGETLSRVVGRGAVPSDKRKFHYDRIQARTMPALAFSASRADRLDAEEAGELLHALHVQFGIDRETEDVLAAFDKALFFEHTINGASLMQEGRGFLAVGTESRFDLAVVKKVLGVDQRRFFRAYADDIADVNVEVIRGYDAYDPVAAEKHGQLMQVAVERGLQKFPHLAHDSSDACLRIGVEARTALMASKRSILEGGVNKADGVRTRVNEKVSTGQVSALD